MLCCKNTNFVCDVTEYSRRGESIWALGVCGGDMCRSDVGVGFVNPEQRSMLSMPTDFIMSSPHEDGLGIFQ